MEKKISAFNYFFCLWVSFLHLNWTSIFCALILFYGFGIVVFIECNINCNETLFFVLVNLSAIQKI